MLHSAPQAEPGSHRNAPRGDGRGIRQIHHHQAESTALHQQIRGLQGVLGIAAAAYPQEPLQPYAGRRGRCRIESVARIHQRAYILAAGGLRHGRQHQAGPPRGCRPVDFGQTPLWQAASHCIHLRQAGRTDLRSVHSKFEIPAQRHGTHIRLLFARTLILQNSATGVKPVGGRPILAAAGFLAGSGRLKGGCGQNARPPAYYQRENGTNCL